MFGSSVQVAETNVSMWKWFPPQLTSRLLGASSMSQCSSKPCVTRRPPFVKMLPPPVIRPVPPQAGGVTPNWLVESLKFVSAGMTESWKSRETRSWKITASTPPQVTVGAVSTTVPVQLAAAPLPPAASPVTGVTPCRHCTAAGLPEPASQTTRPPTMWLFTQGNVSVSVSKTIALVELFVKEKVHVTGSPGANGPGGHVLLPVTPMLTCAEATLAARTKAAATATARIHRIGVRNLSSVLAMSFSLFKTVFVIVIGIERRRVIRDASFLQSRFEILAPRFSLVR